jgi:hypothetical protein
MVIIVADDLGGMQLLLILPIFVVVATWLSNNNTCVVLMWLSISLENKHMQVLGHNFDNGFVNLDTDLDTKIM